LLSDEQSDAAQGISGSAVVHLNGSAYKRAFHLSHSLDIIASRVAYPYVAERDGQIAINQ
jgi:hypothetical protein